MYSTCIDFNMKKFKLAKLMEAEFGMEDVDDEDICMDALEREKKKCRLTLLAVKLVQVDKDPVEIVDRVYIGSIGAAYSKKSIECNGITHIVCASKSPRLKFEPVIQYLRVPIKDKAESDILANVDASIEFIDAALSSSPTAKVLVHCIRGMSRSVSLVIGFLIARHDMTFETALALVRTKRPLANPNCGFERQLRTYARNCGKDKLRQ